MILGESFLRNVLIGKKLVESFGGNPRVLWLGDVFGNNAQIPQIATICGLKYVQFSRGLNEDPPKVFIWRGIGPSEVLSYYGGYGGAIPKSPNEFKTLIDELRRALKKHFLLMSGGDYAVPDRGLPDLVSQLNEQFKEIEICFSTPNKFFCSIESMKQKLPIRVGEMNPTLIGTYSSRIKIKQRIRNVEYVLLSAEAIATTAAILGWNYPSDKFKDCWERLFMVQFHDVIAGSCVDPVYLWALNVLDQIEKEANLLIANALNYIASKANSRTSGIPLIVFNPLPYPRKDVVKVRISFIEKGIASLRVFDENKEIPCQLTDQEFYGEEAPSYLPESNKEIFLESAKSLQKEISDNSLKSATLIFVADLPPLGYKIFNIVKGSPKEYLTDVKGQKLAIENRFFRVSLREDGTIESLVDKVTGEEFVSFKKPFFNTIILQIDRGDFYNILPLPNPKDPYPRKITEIYRRYRKGLSLSNGEVALAKRYYQIGDDKLWGYKDSRHGVKEVKLIESGPVRSTLRVLGEIKFWTTIKLRYVQYIRLYSEIPRIEIETIIEHHGKHYRLRACFPTNIGNGTIRHEIPFGWVKRGEGEYPALNWVDYSNNVKGLCLLNKGLPGNNVVDGIMFLTLMRSTAFEYKGESWRGFMDGEINKYEYALVPHVKGSKWFYPHILGAEYNMPLLAKFVLKSDGRLPRQFSFLSIEPKGVMVSAIYMDRGHIIVRVYEAEGRDNIARIHLSIKVKKAEEITADGKVIRTLRVRDDSCIEVELRPFEIKTIRVAWTNKD